MSCSICFDHSEDIDLTCCNNKICSDCVIKIKNICPYCRSYFQIYLVQNNCSLFLFGLLICIQNITLLFIVIISIHVLLQNPPYEHIFIITFDMMYAGVYFMVMILYYSFNKLDVNVDIIIYYSYTVFINMIYLLIYYNTTTEFISCLMLNAFFSPFLYLIYKIRNMFSCRIGKYSISNI
jgi:hypothetical protein